MQTNSRLIRTTLTSALRGLLYGFDVVVISEAFLEAHVRAFEYFGGVPTLILYDNTTLAVARILGDGERKKTRAFFELESHYLFADKFGRPAEDNDKDQASYCTLLGILNAS